VARAGTTSRSRARSAEQRLGALQRANKIRAERSRLKKDIASGRVQIAEVLSRPPGFAETERVATLLLAVPMFGPARVSKLLARERISATKRLGALTDRQRQALIQHFQD
jgi:S13-like H2TH domain